MRNEIELRPAVTALWQRFPLAVLSALAVVGFWIGLAHAEHSAEDALLRLLLTGSSDIFSF